MGCGNKPDVRDIKVAPDFAQRRMAKCGICEHNSGGVCKLVKDMHPGREALISVGVLMPDAWCPIGQWGQQKHCPIIPGQRHTCQWCNRFHDEETEVCAWCRAKMGMEHRNLTKNIGKTKWGDPYDTRFHEVVPRPFTGPVTRNLHYFLYPKYEESTRYHIEQLRASVDTFNGKRVVCVATDDSTLEDQFRSEIEELFTDVIYAKNNPKLREIVGFVDSLKRLASNDENHVICFAHGKGQQAHTHNTEVIRRWNDTSYETCVRNWSQVKEAMEGGYPITGVFKSIGSFRTTTYKWHYSGAFWWGRSAAVFENPQWQRTCNTWWGSESYVGRHWWPEEAHCLFGDNIAGGSCYDPETWVRLDLELEQWRTSHAATRSMAR